MKLMHTTTTTLNTKEFNQLSDRIIDSLYELNSEISDLYDIHINYIDGEWKIDFIPMISNIPVIHIDTYIEYDYSNHEVLKVVPDSLSELSNQLNLKDYSRSYDLCMQYVSIFEFLLALYDFEYRLN